jgi:hypothetical protein
MVSNLGARLYGMDSNSDFTSIILLLYKRSSYADAVHRWVDCRSYKM